VAGTSPAPARARPALAGEGPPAGCAEQQVDEGARRPADGGAADHVQRQVRPDVEAREADGDRKGPHQRPGAPPEVRAGHGGDRHRDRGVAGDVAKPGGGRAADVHTVEEVGRAAALDQALDSDRQVPDADAGDQQVDGEAVTAGQRGEGRHGRHGDEVAKLHDRPHRRVQEARQVVDQAESVDLEGGHAVAVDQLRGHEQEGDRGRQADQIADMPWQQQLGTLTRPAAGMLRRHGARWYSATHDPHGAGPGGRVGYREVGGFSLNLPWYTLSSMSCTSAVCPAGRDSTISSWVAAPWLTTRSDTVRPGRQPGSQTPAPCPCPASGPLSAAHHGAEPGRGRASWPHPCRSG
jgi:hypothetical protein